MSLTERLRVLAASLRKWLLPWTRARRFAGVIFAEQKDDHTVALRASKLVLVGNREKIKWLKFICPCGCGEVQAVNLMKVHKPYWTVDIHENESISVFPSIYARKCGAHFWIRRNRIDWH